MTSDASELDLSFPHRYSCAVRDELAPGTRHFPPAQRSGNPRSDSMLDVEVDLRTGDARGG